MNLIQKLARASASLGTFQADKRNQQQKYDYISADQVLSRVGAALAAEGVMVIPAISEEVMETVNPKPNQVRYDALVSLEMTITDGETTIVQQWLGRGSDYSVPDKALYKAITSGHKYFLMKLQNVGIGNEDGEHDEAQAAKNGASQPAAPINDKQRKQLHAVGTKLYGDEWDDKRKEMSAAFQAKSSNEWTSREASRVIDGMNEMLAEMAENDPLFVE